jgi:hypothetical protein
MIELRASGVAVKEERNTDATVPITFTKQDRA